LDKSFFDPHKSLLELGIIRFSAFILLLVFFLSTIAVINHKDLVWRFDYDGFNYAINLFRVPFGIAALAIPIMAILAANHRSEQSREQMRLTSAQNVFSNHYKHVEEFEKYCIRVYDRIIENDKIAREFYEKKGGAMKFMASESFIPTNINSQYSRLLYKKLYPRSIFGDMKMSDEFLNLFDSFISGVLDIFLYFNIDDKAGWYSAIKEVDEKLRGFSEDNYIDLRYIGAAKVTNINGVDVKVPSGDVMYFVRQLQDVTHAIEDVLAFDILYAPSEVVKKIAKANLERLPAWDIDDIQNWKPVNISVFLANN
jgi:hypothetical protein